MNTYPITFPSGNSALVGMVHPAAGTPETGVLIMVAGGPQYRIGGHRQLVLWGRKIAKEGFPVFRFDFRGMGDSYGAFVDFEHADDDIRAALDRFFAEVPSLKRVVLWGECNACSSSLFFAHKDPRIAGLVMLNPWVRTQEGQAKTVIKHYYLHRLTERSFWAKVFRLQFDLIGSLRSALHLLRLARSGPSSSGQPPTDGGGRHGSLPERMLDGLQRFRGRIMLVMSGRDFVAKEFDDLVKASPQWQMQLESHNTQRHDLEFADHTFSTSAWRDQVAAWGIAWLHELVGTNAVANPSAGVSTASRSAIVGAEG